MGKTRRKKKPGEIIIEGAYLWTVTRKGPPPQKIYAEARNFREAGKIKRGSLA